MTLPLFQERQEEAEEEAETEEETWSDKIKVLPKHKNSTNYQTFGSNKWNICIY